MDFEHLYLTTYRKVHAYARLAAASDLELLERVMAHPVDRRRRRPVAIPAVAVATLVATVFVLLGGNRPDSASALSQAMHWFDPPAGKVLHSLVVDETGNTREIWQDVDHPERSRTVLPGGYEVGAGAIYERATNTIYEDDGTGKRLGPDPKADAAKQAKLANAGRTGSETQRDEAKAGTIQKTPAETAPSGDPLIAKVRVLIAEGHAAVRGREGHDGVEAWKIMLTSGGRPPWVLWVRADNGMPLAIDDPGDPARDKAPEHSRWTKYEVLDGDAAPLTLREAHPDARVVKYGARFDALLAGMNSR